MKKTGEILREYREKRKYTLAKLAEKIDRSLSYINDIEKERKPFPKKELGEKIIEVLGISFEDVEAIHKYEDYKRTPDSVKEALERLRAVAYNITKKHYKEIIIHRNTEQTFDSFNKNIKKELIAEGFSEKDIELLELETEEKRNKFVFNKEIASNLSPISDPQKSRSNENKKKREALSNSRQLPVYEHLEHGQRKIITGEIIDYYVFDGANEKELIAVLMRDNCMEPFLPKSSYLVIEKSLTVKDEEAAAFFLNGDLLIRKLKTYGELKVLRGINNTCEDIEIKDTDNFMIYGKVIEYKLTLI